MCRLPARRKDRGWHGSGPPCPCEGWLRSFQLVITTFLIQWERTGFQNPHCCPLPLQAHLEREAVRLGEAKHSPLSSWLLPLSSLQHHLKTNLVGFFFFFLNTVSKQLLQRIAADGPAGCGRGWQLPSAGAWPLSSSRSTKISSPCSP